MNESTQKCGAERAKYSDRLFERVGAQWPQEFVRGFQAKRVRRMVQFAQVFAQIEIGVPLSAKLSWSHMVAIVVPRNVLTLVG